MMSNFLIYMIMFIVALTIMGWLAYTYRVRSSSTDLEDNQVITKNQWDEEADSPIIAEPLTSSPNYEESRMPGEKIPPPELPKYDEVPPEPPKHDKVLPEPPKHDEVPPEPPKHDESHLPVVEVPPDSPEPASPSPKPTEELRKNFTETSKITSGDQKLVLDYLGNPAVWTKAFTIKKIPQLGKVANFGIRLLSGFEFQHRADASKPNGYLIVVEDMIKQVDAELSKTEFSEKKSPWGQSWYDASVLLTRLLATYQILGTDQAVKKICHKRILELTPKLDDSLAQKYKGVKLMWVAIPRLITNFINDPEAHRKDLEAPPIPALANLMKGEYTDDDIGSGDGIHSDWSHIYDKVATFWPLAESGEFYTSVFRTFKYPTGLEGRITGIFDQLLHPNLDFVPFGVFGRHAEVKCTQVLASHWPNYRRNATYGTRIWPLMGLGVFKSSRFAFWVRVQRPNIAAYLSDREHFDLALGWIQMRKLYLVEADYHYDNGIPWPNLKGQPGVVSFEDFNDFDELKPEPGKPDRNLDVEVLDSHIGHFEVESERVLYWKQKYKFKLYGDSTFEEFGVCTDNGVVMRLEICNLTGRTLSLSVQDPDLVSKITFHHFATFAKDRVESLSIAAGKTAVIEWRQVFDANIVPLKCTVIHDRAWNKTPSDAAMRFKTGKKFYNILSDGSRHYVMDGREPIHVGSSEAHPPADFQYTDGTGSYRFHYDKNTLMYSRSDTI